MIEFIKMLNNICKENRIQLLRPERENLVQLTWCCRSAYIYGYDFDINNGAATAMCRQKDVVSSVLDANCVPHVTHISCKNDNNALELSREIKDFLRLNDKLIVKPNTSQHGKNVYVAEDYDSAMLEYLNVKRESHKAAICPYFDIDAEFRAVVLDGEVKLLYSKERPYVVGDGKRTAFDLLMSCNDIKYDIDKNYCRSNILRYVPARNETVLLEWRHNLSYGSKACVIDQKNLYVEAIDIALRAARALGLRFCTVDIIRVYGAYMVLGMHSDVNLTSFAKQQSRNFDIAEKIYADAVFKMLSIM